jgi:hypothetical protein
MMAIGWLLNLNRYGTKTLRCKLWARARQARGEINLFVRKTFERLHVYFNIKYLCFTLPICHFRIWTIAKRQGRLVIIAECEVEGTLWRLCGVRSSAKSRSDVGSHGDESGTGVASDESQNS